MTDHDRLSTILEESGMSGPEYAPMRDLLAGARQEVEALEVPPSPQVARMLMHPPVRRARLRRRLGLAAGAATLSVVAVSGGAAAGMLPDPVQEFVTEFPASLPGGGEEGPAPAPGQESDQVPSEVPAEAPSPVVPSAPEPTVEIEVPTTPGGNPGQGERAPETSRAPDSAPSASPSQRGNQDQPRRGERPSATPTPTGGSTPTQGTRPGTDQRAGVDSPRPTVEDGVERSRGSAGSSRP